MSVLLLNHVKMKDSVSLDRIFQMTISVNAMITQASLVETVQVCAEKYFIPISSFYVIILCYCSL